MLGLKLTIVVLDNRGFGCINRLQRARAARRSTTCSRTRGVRLPDIDFAAHAASLGARAGRRTLAELEDGAAARRTADRTNVIVIDTDPSHDRGGGHWWDVAVPECLAPQRGQGAAAIRGSAGARRSDRCRAASGQHARHAMTVRIGVNPIGWSNDDLRELGGETPLENCAGRSQGGGFEGMELGNKFPREPGALKPWLARHGLASSPAGTRRSSAPGPRRRDGGAAPASRPPQGEGSRRSWSSPRPQRRPRRPLEAARRAPASSEARDWPEFGRRVTQVAERTLAEGVRLVYHHHMGTIVESRPTSTPS